MTSGIYIIKNLKSGKCYIGKDSKLPKRWQHHRRHLILNNHENKLLQRAWNKYGENNFSCDILEYCSNEELSKREIYYIESLNTKTPKGYNLTGGGDGCQLGATRPPNVRKKISKSLTGRKHSPERIKNISLGRKGKMTGKNNPNFGKKFSIEHRKKLSRGHIGKQKGIENPMFGVKMKGRTSKYFGVYKKGTKRWECAIKVNGKQIYVASGKDELLCAKKYDIYIKNNNLPHPLNFPNIHP
jgi:group I intron endonuclease